MATDSIEALIEEYLARKLSGSPVTPDELAAAHPEHADVLRRRLAQLAALDVLQPAGSAVKFDVPRSFDGFELVRELGRGGMGVVYEARQVALGRRVAIKVIAGGGALSPRLRERFEREITTLARISHPGIVKVFGSGSVAGAPYVAMELVEGEPLTRRLPGDGERASRERVDEFVRIGERVARALAHVHELGVVHRDVKPGNVLIDARGEPVLLDFGLARDDERDSVTATGEFVGTLAYTAPEQARGERVDRRADVYGLGATLYHLVTGSPPYRARSIADLVRQLESGPPSSAARANPALPRDLATVLDHALQPDPLRRYGSCADLAEDLERFARGVPILAQPPGAWSSLRAFARRHRALVAGGATVVAALLAGLATTLWQARRAQHEAVRAMAQRDWSELLFREGFKDLEPSKRREALQRAEPQARELLGEFPDLLANSLDMLGTLSLEDGQREEADRLTQEARSLRQTAVDEGSEDRVESDFSLASLKQDEGQYQEAIDLYLGVEAYYARRHLEADRNSLTAASNRAQCLLALGRIDEGLALLRTTIDATRKALGADDVLALIEENTLARWQVEHGQLAEGRKTLERLVELRRAAPDKYDVDSLAWLNNLADAERRSSNCPRAIELLEQVLAERSQRLGATHPSTLSSKTNLVATLIGCGKEAEAQAPLTQMIPLLEQALGPADPECLRALDNLAFVQRKMGELAESESNARTVIERGAEAGMADSEYVASAQYLLGDLLQRRGEWNDSEEPLLAALRFFGAHHADLMRLVQSLADHCASQGQVDDAARVRAALDRSRAPRAEH